MTICHVLSLNIGGALCVINVGSNLMRLLTFILLLCIPALTLAQHTHRVHGVVSDSAGAPVPFVNVFIENSTKGVITDLKGRYFLDLEAGDYVIVFRNLEYEELKETLHVEQVPVQLNVTLAPSVEVLETVTVRVSDRDPAYEIIEKAIKNRKRYLKQYDSYSMDNYIKCSLEKEVLGDTVPDSVELSKEHHNFIESYSTTYFQYPGNQKQVVSAYNDHQNHDKVREISVSYGWDDEGPPVGGATNSYLFRQSTSEQGFNFYKNLINHPRLGSTPFTSPIASTALLSYKYRLVETFVKDKRIIYKIEVIPRRKESATFTGHVFIESETYALSGVDLELNPRALYMFKKFHINHEYGVIQDSLRVLTREEYFYNTKEGRQRIFGTTILVHSNYQINPEFEKGFFKNEIKLIKDDAYEKDSLFWADNRPVELRPEEAEFVRYQDSVIAYHTSAAYLNEQDSIYNRVKILDFFIFGLGFRNWTKKQEIRIDPLIAQVRPFGVGGYRHVLPVHYQKEWKRGNAIQTSLMLDYGFHNRDLKGSIDTRYTYLPKKFGKIHVKVGDTYEMVNTYESLAAVFSRSNYINRKGLTLGHSMEFFNGFYADIDFEYAENHPITGIELANWSEQLFGELNTPKDFERFNESYLDVHITYTFKQKYYNEPYKKVILPSKYPQLKVWYKKGIKGLFGSIVDFDFLELHLQDEVTLGTFGESKWSGRVGRFITQNNVQLTNYKYFRGSDRFFFSNPLMSFQLLGPTIGTTNAYFQGNYIHHFNGALMSKIPLINKLRLQSVGGASILLVEDNNFSHIEAFVGLERPFRLFGDLFKVGVYFVTSDSNHSDLDATFKIGIDFFNAFTQKWSY